MILLTLKKKLCRRPHKGIGMASIGDGMTITPANIVRHELIGLEARITKAVDPKKIGFAGKIVDETQKTLLIRTPQGEKQIAKKECSFEFIIPNGQRVEVDGRLLVGRPEDRMKKKLPEKWEMLEKK